ncbi:MAG: hypothetical protein Q8P26_03770 [Candidatus Levybacteria bacterium]|nr:hypothetical protein [Candidatus Levybacteria bacterium]
MTERETFDDSLREEVIGFRNQIYSIWPKLDEVGLSGQFALQEALRKHPQLQQAYSEGRPIVRAICSLGDEGEPSNSGIGITIYRPGEQGISPEALRTNIELYESGIGIIEGYDFGGGLETGPRREIIPTRHITKRDMPMIEAATSLIISIANSV